MNINKKIYIELSRIFDGFEINLDDKIIHDG